MGNYLISLSYEGRKILYRATTLGGGTAISGGGAPDTGCGTPFRPVPAEFNMHWCHVQRGLI